MRNERGMTLVEVLVAMAISTVLIALVCGILLSSMDTVGRGSVVSEKGQFVSEVYRLVESTLVDATSISLTADGGEGERSFGVEGGRFQMGGVQTYDDSVYRSGRLEVSITGRGEYIDLSVTLQEAGGGGMSKQGSFRILNTEFNGSASGDLTVYFTPETADTPAA